MRKLASVMLCVCLLMLCQGCSVKKMNTEKIRDVEITVLEEEKIPEEFLTQIEEKSPDRLRLRMRTKMHSILHGGMENRRRAVTALR